MDTKKDSAVSDVPTFKVARVGNERKRKGGAFSFLRGGGTRGVWQGAAGGSGAGSGAGGMAAIGAGLNFSKMLLIFLVSVGGLGAVGLGRMLGNMSGDDVKKPKAFSMASRDAVKIEGDTSNLPSNTNTIPNSLGYLSGSTDGLTPEERAKKAAEAAAAAEAQRIADEEAAKKAEKDNLAGKAVDPAALLASAKADGGNGNGGKGGGFGKKFGALSSSMGGGSSLSGGAGMSGGVNRQFGSSGSIAKGSSGQLSASKAASRPTYSKGGNARLAGSNTKGFARKQLANANSYSRRGAAASKGETAASDAGTAFDNNVGAGSAISGPGIGKGKGSSNGADSTPNPGGGGGSNNGGPTGNGPVDCGADKYQDANGVCQTIDTTAGKDAKPMLTMLANIAMGLLAAIAVISAIKAAVEGSFVASEFGPVLGAIIGIMGGIIAALGVYIMSQGDYAGGLVYTLTGGFIAAVAFIPGASTILTSGTMVIASAAGLVLGQAAKMLDKGNHKDKAPVAAQQ